MANLYDVMDNYECKMVLCAVTQKDVEEYFGRHVTCNQYAKKKHSFRAGGKTYSVFISGQKIAPRKVNHSTVKECTRLRKEWEEVRHMFKDVKWVKEWKPGVKKLGE